jgi:hypothetical protein
MTALITPAWLVACAVLVTAGAAKLAPGRTPRSGGRLGRAARVIGCGEIALGGGAALAPRPILAACVAAAYGAFAVVLMRQLRSGATHGCGCFGAASTAPARPLQVGLNAVCGLVAGGAVLDHPHGAGWLATQPLTVVAPVGLGLATATMGVVAAFTLLAGVWQASARRRCRP